MCEGLRAFPPFHLMQIHKKYVHRLRWEEGWFVFYPPPKYNLFQYLHDLLLKGSTLFPILFWFINKLRVGERERSVIANSSTLLKKRVSCFILLREAWQ